jgi:hypothetical protein
LRTRHQMSLWPVSSTIRRAPLLAIVQRIPLQR